MISLNTKKLSPFKFLDSYKKNDINSYFGRDKESLELFELYKDSSIMILHGPSGSGKTSLIYCGLLNKISEGKKVISIRRDDNIIESIKKNLFKFDTTNEDPQSCQPQLIDDFLTAHYDLNRVLKSIEHIEGMMLDVEEETVRLRQNKKKSDIVSINQTSDTTQEDPKVILEKYKERLRQFSSERKALLEKLREKNTAINAISNTIYEYFINLGKSESNTLFSPLIIFDQFEELFVYGSKDEINKFGLFLKLVFDYKIPFNIIISLREEYFGHIDQLQSYVPHIFYKKIRLAHPNEEIVKNIIEKSFEEFNINQYKDHSEQFLSQEEKQERIALILDQIKIQNNETYSYHLPFLQVYLDRLYKVDFDRTFDSNLTKETQNYPPLEFKQEEIKEFGSIEYVLESYIREVNDKIIKNTNNKLNNGVEHKDSVIKFLRHFKTRDDLKKRVPIRTTNKDKYYVIDDQKISNDIQTDIWGNINEEEYKETISEIIEELTDKGILKVSTDQKISTDYAELSHDIIAKVISNIRTEDDFRSLIKKDFDSSFAIYEDTGRKEDLLNLQKIMRIRQYKDFIVSDENEDTFILKQQFFDESIIEVEKEKREKEKQNIKLRKYFNYSRIISVLMLISLIILAYNYKDIRNAKNNWFNEKSKREITDKINKFTGLAFKEYKVDKTSSFNYFQKSEAIFLENIDSLDPKAFDLLGNFKNDLFKDYVKAPFYFNSISLGEGHIIKTKTRRLKYNDSTLYVFALTASNKLIARSLLYKKKNDRGKEIFKENNIIAFEPFIDEEGNLMTFIASKTLAGGENIYLQLLNIEGKPYILDRNGSTKITVFGNQLGDIEHQDNYSFLIGIDNEMFQVNLSYRMNNGNRNSIKQLKVLSEEIRRIKVFPDDHKNYFALYGDNKLYKSNDTVDDILDSKNITDDFVYTFKVLKDKSILLGLNGKIERYGPDSTYLYKQNFIDDKVISAIDIDNSQTLVGSYDKTATLWNANGRLLKQLFGHTAAIRNVSFIDNDYVITSGEDQTIKIWNIAPVALSTNKVKGEISQIYFKNENEILLVHGKRKESQIARLKSDLSINADNIKENISRFRSDHEIINGLNITKDKILVLPNSDTIRGVNSIRYNGANKRVLAIASDNNNIYMYDFDEKKTNVILAHTDKVIDIDFSKSGNYMVSGSKDNRAIIWEINKNNTFIPLDTLTAHTSDIEDVAFYKDELLLTASSDNTVQIYKKEKGKKHFTQIPSLIRHNYGVTAATFSPNGRYIVSGDTKGNIKKWNLTKFDSIVNSRTYSFTPDKVFE